MTDALPPSRLGYPQLHIYGSMERRTELGFIHRMFAAWGHAHGASMHVIPHRGDWHTMGAVYDNGPPALAPHQSRKS